jgi:hypothetical protein
MMENPRKQSAKYDVDNLAEAFGIQAIDECPILTEWLNATATLSGYEHETIETLRQKLIKSGSNWNEEELKIQFIGVLLFIADIDEDRKIKTFFERSLSATVQNIPLSVIADCVIASPKGLGGSPRSPYFFLQEYKKSKGDKQDPEGQMLTAMIISQELNQDGQPLYGCWIVGSNWYFTVLNGVGYCVSRQFDATREPDLMQIVFILRKLKQLILARIK